MWLAENSGRIEFGIHPRTGRTDIGIYLCGWYRIRDEEVSEDIPTSLLTLITRVRQDRERE